MSNLFVEKSAAPGASSSNATTTQQEFTARLPAYNTTAARDKEDRDVRAQFQNFLRQGYWFLYEGSTAIPGITWPMVCGIQEMREAYYEKRSIHEIEVPKGVRENLKIAKYNKRFPDDSVIVWVVQRKQGKKGLGPPIPQPPGLDPDIPECSKGVRIPLLGDPLPRILMDDEEAVNHYPRIDHLNPNKIIQSPEVKKAEEERVRLEVRAIDAAKVAEEKRRVAAAKAKKEATAALAPTRASSRAVKPTVLEESPPSVARPTRTRKANSAVQEGKANQAVASVPGDGAGGVVHQPLAGDIAIPAAHEAIASDGPDKVVVAPTVDVGAEVVNEDKDNDQAEIIESAAKKSSATEQASDTIQVDADGSKKRKAEVTGDGVGGTQAPPPKRTRTKADSVHDTIQVNVPLPAKRTRIKTKKFADSVEVNEDEAPDDMAVTEGPSAKPKRGRPKRKVPSDTIVVDVETISKNTLGSKCRLHDEIDEADAPRPTKKPRTIEPKMEDDDNEINVVPPTKPGRKRKAVSKSVATDIPAPAAKRTRNNPKTEENDAAVDGPAIPAKRGGAKKTKSEASALDPDAAPLEEQPAREVYLDPTFPDPPMPKGKKPRSRIVKICVNCGKESSMAWRDRHTADRNDCMWCQKRRDKKS